MIALTVADVVAATGGAAVAVEGSTDIASVVVDSRSAAPGALFVAIRGDRVDGHDFAEQAVSAGAVAVLAQRPLARNAGDALPCIVVDDPVVALGRLASWVRHERLTCTVIGITGSSGKTTTKDLTAAVLARVAPTVSPIGSFNTEVGLPLTVLSADASTRYLVLEMGMRGEGHIAYLVDLMPPDVGVVLNVGTAHLELLGSQEAIARAKGEMVRGLTADAVAVLNADDPRTLAMASTTPARVVTFGEGPDSDIRAVGVRLDELARPSFTIVDAPTGQSASVALLFSGGHGVSNALAAAAVARAVGVGLPEIAEALSAAEPVSRWRMEVRSAPRGFTLVNDAYNANPESMAAALRALAAMSDGRRTWAVLGEMRELGGVSRQEHEAIGRLAADLGTDRLVCVGDVPLAMHLAASREVSWRGESVHVADADAAIALLQAEVGSGDVVLVKASRSIGLERVAAALLEDGDAA